MSLTSYRAAPPRVRDWQGCPALGAYGLGVGCERVFQSGAAWRAPCGARGVLPRVLRAGAPMQCSGTGLLACAGVPRLLRIVGFNAWRRPTLPTLER